MWGPDPDSSGFGSRECCLMEIWIRSYIELSDPYLSYAVVVDPDPICRIRIPWMKFSCHDSESTFFRIDLDPILDRIRVQFIIYFGIRILTFPNVNLYWLFLLPKDKDPTNGFQLGFGSETFCLDPCSSLPIACRSGFDLLFSRRRIRIA